MHCFPVNPLCLPDAAQHSVPLKSTKDTFLKDFTAQKQQDQLCHTAEESAKSTMLHSAARPLLHWGMGMLSAPAHLGPCKEA